MTPTEAGEPMGRDRPVASGETDSTSAVRA